VAACFDLFVDADGEWLRLSPLPVDSCPGFVVLDATEYTGSIVLADLFAIPLTADLSSAWAAGFTLPLVVYLSAWALGCVVNFVNVK